MLKALIFDVDGTLADTEKDGHRIAFNQAFAEAGLNWNWSVEIYGQLLEVTGGKERIRSYMEKYLDAGQQADLGDKYQNDQFIAKLHKLKTGYYMALLDRGEIPLRCGVRRLLKEARQAGLRLAIATTTTPANVTALLKNTLGAESEAWFDIIGAGDIVPNNKPAADIYQYVLDEMAWSAEECLAFEDSFNGIRSSCGASLKTLVTINDYTHDHDFTGAALVLDKLGEADDPFQILAEQENLTITEKYVDVALLHKIMADKEI